MSGVREAILDDIIANPDDDTPRLVMADWLDENGDPERADFIRVQIALGRMPEDDERRWELEDREHILLARHRNAWARELPEGITLDLLRPAGPFVRGLVDAVECTAETYIRGGLGFRHPIRSARLMLTEGVGDPGYDLRPDGLEAAGPLPFERVVESPVAERLTGLDLRYQGLTPEQAAMIAASTHFRGLRELNLAANLIEAAGLKALAESARLPRLESLIVYDNRVRSEGVECLAASSLSERLRTLDIGKTAPDDSGGLLAILSRTRFQRLLSLGLREAGLGAADIVRLCDSTWLAGLESLDLSLNPVTEDGVIALADCPRLAGLRSLRLDHMSLTVAGITALASSAHLGRLRTLHLSFPWDDRLGPAGATALTSSPAVKGMDELSLDCQDIGDEGAIALARWPGLAGVRRLNLGRNRIGTEGAAALAASPHLSRIEVLKFHENALGDLGAASLAGRFPRLRKLLLYGCDIGPAGGEALLRADWPATLTELHLRHNRLDGMEEAFRARFGDIVRI